MAKAREIQKRRQAVRNIHKITKVMQMIATARFQKALKRARDTRLYAQKLQAMAESILRSPGTLAEVQRHPLFKTRQARRTALLIVTSNRGLAGGYNSQILRLAMLHIRGLERESRAVDVHVAGKKGAAYFRFARREVRAACTKLGDSPAYEQVAPVARHLLDDYAAGRVDAVKIVYMRFFSVGRQKPFVADVLPPAVWKTPAAGGQTGRADQTRPAKIAAACELIPDAGDLLADLLPTLVQAAVFQAFIDAAVSEQIARMVAMSTATENAETMSRRLSRDYNRARQSQITSELSELMGGVESLK